ncbi:MAG: hypothetical protein ACREDY_19740 [Bradyrhizobium sp.]
MPKGKPVSACARAASEVDASRIKARATGRKLIERIKSSSHWSMIRKSVQRFSEKIMLNKKLERDDDSKKSHRALLLGLGAVLFDARDVEHVRRAEKMSQKNPRKPCDLRGFSFCARA